MVNAATRPARRRPGFGNSGMEEARMGNEKLNESDPFGTSLWFDSSLLKSEDAHPIVASPP